MSNFGTFTVFVMGVLTGSIITRVYSEKKYEKILQEEIDSVKKAFKKSKPVTSDETNVHNYMKKVRENGYAAWQNRKEEEKEMEDKPYVISPDEFGENDEYEQISLTYFSDGFLADENDEIVENIDEKVGYESLGRFGEYEEDSVFVRNDRLKCDYEILKDQRYYADIHRKTEKRMED